MSRMIDDEETLKDNGLIEIDGCNVAECKYFNKVINEEPYCNIDEEHLYTCNSDNNCYFKQLQRAKAELEQYKNKTPFINCKTCSQVAELKASDKIEFKQYYNAKNDELKRKLKSYKQALKDISEIAYTTDFDIVDIQKIVNEVLND